MLQYAQLGMDMLMALFCSSTTQTNQRQEVAGARTASMCRHNE
jgi:hypothetical protein